MSGTTTNPLATAAALIAGGLTVTSTSTASLNGTYQCDDLARGAMGMQNMEIAQNNDFVGGTQTLNWPDTSGAMHAFTPAQFVPFVIAIDAFYSACLTYAAGASAGPPASTATIP